MQITQVPIQPASNVVTQPQTLSNTLPQVLTQAVAPISGRAIPPTVKAETGQKSRRRTEKDDPEPQNRAEDGDDHVNISI